MLERRPREYSRQRLKLTPQVLVAAVWIQGGWGVRSPQSLAPANEKRPRHICRGACDRRCRNLAPRLGLRLTAMPRLLGDRFPRSRAGADSGVRASNRSLTRALPLGAKRPAVFETASGSGKRALYHAPKGLPSSRSSHLPSVAVLRPLGSSINARSSMASVVSVPRRSKCWPRGC
jgi:hypothetical protein